MSRPIEYDALLESGGDGYDSDTGLPPILTVAQTVERDRPIRIGASSSASRAASDDLLPPPPAKGPRALFNNDEPETTVPSLLNVHEGVLATGRVEGVGKFTKSPSHVRWMRDMSVMAAAREVLVQDAAALQKRIEAQEKKAKKESTALRKEKQETDTDIRALARLVYEASKQKRELKKLEDGLKEWDKLSARKRKNEKKTPKRRSTPQRPTTVVKRKQKKKPASKKKAPAKKKKAPAKKRKTPASASTAKAAKKKKCPIRSKSGKPNVGACSLKSWVEQEDEPVPKKTNPRIKKYRAVVDTYKK